MELTTLVKTTFSALLVASTRLLVFTSLCIVSVQAATYSMTATWESGTNAGLPAISCNYLTPDGQPFSAPLTLVVDNSMPANTVLYSWDYSEFLPNYTINCIGSGIKNSIPSIRYSDGSISTTGAFIELRGPVTVPLPTNNSGIVVKLYLMYGQNPLECKGCVNTRRYKLVNGPNYGGIGGSGGSTGFVEYEFNYSLMPNGRTGMLTIPILQESNGEWYFESDSATTGSFSVKGEIIKVGQVAYDSASTPIIFKHGWSTLQLYVAGAFSNSGLTPSILMGGNGINIVPPACQLKNLNYTVTMPVWVALGANTRAPYNALPARGSETPVDLSLQCSGQVPNVRFKFEDLGNALLSNKNLSLYDSGDNNKVDGLEIEMLYNSTHVDIDNSTETNVGTHGKTKQKPSDSPVYDSESTVNFSARFIQTAAITKNGNAYTGPVTGKVNMWVTYD